MLNGRFCSSEIKVRKQSKNLYGSEKCLKGKYKLDLCKKNVYTVHFVGFYYDEMKKTGQQNTKIAPKEHTAYSNVVLWNKL